MNRNTIITMIPSTRGSVILQKYHRYTALCTKVSLVNGQCLFLGSLEVQKKALSSGKDYFLVPPDVEKYISLLERLLN